MFRRPIQTIRRRRTLGTLTLAALMCAGGCGEEPKKPSKEQAKADVVEAKAAAEAAAKVEAGAPPTAENSVVAPAKVEYGQSLTTMLDMVPADETTYVVVRDLRPLVDRAREIEGVVSGPLTSLTEAFAGVDQTVDTSGMKELGKTLQDILGAVDGSGIALEKGMVLTSIDDQALVVFSAESLEGMPPLLEALGAAGDDSKKMQQNNCMALAKSPGWFGCSEGGKKLIEKYEAGGKGTDLEKALAQALPGVDLANANAAFASVDGLDEAHAALSTDPGLWHLGVSLPSDALSVFEKGKAKALRSAEPGDSFVWATVDLSGLPQQLIPAQMTELVGSLDGEVYLGIDHAADGDQVGVMAQVGVTDPGPARGGLAYAATQLEGLPTALPGAEDTKLTWGTEIVTYGEDKLALLTLKGEGEGAKTFTTALDLPAHGTAFASHDYLTVVAGEGKEVIPAHLAQKGEGPSVALLRSLPAPLTRDLLADEVSALYHFEADGLQVPFEDDVLEYGLMGVPEDQRPPADVLRTLYGFLAPYSSLSAWLSHIDSHPVIHIALRDFGHGASDEGKAAQAALAKVQGGEDGAKVYGKLADDFASSPRANAYAARAGRADRTTSAMGLMTTGVLINMLTSAVANYRMQAAMQQMPPSMLDPNAGLGGMGAPPPGSLQLTPPGRGR